MHSRRRHRVTVGSAAAGLLAGLLLFFGLGSVSNAIPSLGVGEAPLSGLTSPPSTLQDVIDEIGVDANEYGTGTDFVGAFGANDYSDVALTTGNYVTSTGAFTLAADATVGATGLDYQIVFHAEAASPAADSTFVLAMQVTDSSDGTVTIEDLMTLIDSGSGVSDLGAASMGLVVFEGDGTLAALPGDSGVFVAGALNESTLPSPLTDPAAGTADAGQLHVYADVTGGTRWDGAVDLVGAEGQPNMPMSGAIAASVADMALQHSPSAATGQLGALSLDVVAAPTVPIDAASDELGALALSVDTATTGDWTFHIDYDTAGFVAIDGAGAVWNITVPELFPGGTTFTPTYFIGQGIGLAPSSTPRRVGGEIGTFTLPGTTTDMTVSARFSKEASDYIADFAATIDVTPTKQAAFSAVFRVNGGAPSMTLTAQAPDMTVAELGAAFTNGGMPTSSDVPSSVLDTEITNPILSVDFAPGSVQIGATGQLVTSSFEGGTVGTSLMFAAELLPTPSVMVGVAPSVRPIGIGLPEGNAIKLSDIVPGATGGFDFNVYDPADPTTGLGLLFSSKQNLVGGDECRVDDAAGCPTGFERQNVTTNVAQWLMPLYGFDGSNLAVLDSTDISGQCEICSFRDDYQPATGFTVSQGFTAVGSVNVTGKAAKALGDIGLDSKVTVAGTVPIPGSTGAFALTLGAKLSDDALSRPAWLYDGALSVTLAFNTGGTFQASLTGSIDVAVKQGFSAAEADAMFGAGSAAAAKNTLQPATGTCPREGVEIEERDNSAGFTAGEMYCHDLLRGELTGDFIASSDGFVLDLVADLGSINEDGNPTSAGWSPMGFDKISIGQVTGTLRIETTSTSGADIEFGGAFSASINTTPNIPFSAAISIGLKPNVVVLNGLRLDVAQVSLANLVEIYEWISGENVPADDLPGVQLRNLSINVGSDDYPALCIDQGFAISGDLYLTDGSVADPTDYPVFSCDSLPSSNTYGSLDPAPAAPCDQAAIDAGCAGGIRLIVNERGLIGDGFMVGFDAGPVHVYQPSTGATIPPEQAGRAVSIRVEIKKTSIFAHIYGGAALGGSANPATCSSGPYCDAWANGEFNAKFTAGIGGADLKLYGRMNSGLPGLSFQMLVAGQVTIPGAAEMGALFTDGTIPDSQFKLHIELANTEAAPDLDFAGALQDDVNADFEKVVAGLNDALSIANKLKSGDAAGAKSLLKKYENDDPFLKTLVDIVADIQSEASDDDLNTKLDWLLQGTYFGVPGVPNVFDIAAGKDIPRCDGLNWGYGPSGKNKYTSGASYPDNFCFLHKPFYVPGLCSALAPPSGTTCDLDYVTQKMLIEPIMEIVIAGINVSIDVTAFAQDVTNLVLDGELFRVDCASFDIDVATGESMSNGFEGSIGFGLFVTVMGNDLGAAFTWKFDDTFVNNAGNLGAAMLDALGGTTDSTCWTPAQLQAFFGNEVENPEEPPAPAELSSVTVIDGTTLASNTVLEGSTAVLTATFDGTVDATRVLSVDWGDGSSAGSITIPSGASSGTATHTYVDDGAAAASTETKSVVVTDTTTTTSISTSVSVVNVDPTVTSVTADFASINENESLALTVEFSDPGLDDWHAVSVAWDDGTTTGVTLNADTSSTTATVSISHQYLQNPLDEVANIVVTVTDKDGGEDTSTIDVDVLNVAPVITGVDVANTLEGIATDYTVSWTDPGTLDRHALTFIWGDNPVPQFDSETGDQLPDEVWIIGVDATTGDPAVLIDELADGLGENDADYDPTTNTVAPDRIIPITTTGLVRSVTAPHTFRDDNPTNTPADDYDVLITIIDIPDGDTGTETHTVNVADVAPLVSIDHVTQTVQYSDEIDEVTITASDVAPDVLVADAAITQLDSLGDPIPGSTRTLPVAGLSVSAPICVPAANDRQSCTWDLTGIVDDGAGVYEIAVTITDDDTLSTTVTTELVIEQEDAVVDFLDSNPVDVRVSEDGGTSPEFTLRADISELVPDIALYGAHPGDIERAEVSMTLAAVGPGSSYTVDCVPESVDPVSFGYDQHLIVTCDFDNVDVNTYHVQVTVDGKYWTGFGEDVVTISDPSLGFTTGGGWFYWPGTNDRTNFGYTMKYNKKRTNIQGSILIMRHLDDGRTMRIKSNSVEALAIGTGNDDGEAFGWASMTSKATWRDAGWEDAVGNHQVVMYVEDRGEPGTDDMVWVELRDKDRNVVADMTMERVAYEKSVHLEGGNIVVPHSSSGGKPPKGK